MTFSLQCVAEFVDYRNSYKMLLLLSGKEKMENILLLDLLVMTHVVTETTDLDLLPKASVMIPRPQNRTALVDGVSSAMRSSSTSKRTALRC